MTHLRTLAAATAAAFALALAGGVAAAGAATPHDPIVFVHGWKENGGMWGPMIANFQADGWTAPELNTWDYNTSQSNVTTASQLRTKVDSVLAATGNAKVDLITHSMGGLNSRYYIKNLQGEGKVDDWVSLGGPNHGTRTASFCPETSCVEMRPNSTFLKNLNAGDETPGLVNYGTWWSPCDEVINPQTSTILSGARNTQTACIEHVALASDPTVYGQVRDFVR
jgi:triacylglycerol lipase